MTAETNYATFAALSILNTRANQEQSLEGRVYTNVAIDGEHHNVELYKKFNNSACRVHEMHRQ